RLGVGIVVFQVVVNGSFELGNRSEDAATDALLSDQAEEALDLIEPGGRSGGEMQVKAGVLGQPCLHAGMLVGGVVIEDEVKIEFFGVCRWMVRKKRRNSRWRWRFMHCPITAP